MTDDSKLHAATNRAMRAKALLGDELLIEAFNVIEADLVERWKASNPRDTDGRERVWNALQAVGKVKEFLHYAVANGAIATRELLDKADK
jgi:hypothetical protein